MKNSRYIYQIELDEADGLMVAKFFVKKPSSSGINNELMANQELPEELHKPIMRKYENWKV